MVSYHFTSDYNDNMDIYHMTTNGLQWLYDIWIKAVNIL